MYFVGFWCKISIDLSSFGRFTASCGLVDKTHTTFLKCPHFSSGWGSLLHVIPLHLSSHVSCLWLFSLSRQNVETEIMFDICYNCMFKIFKIKQTKQLSQRHHDTSRHPSPPPLFIIFLNSRLCRILMKTFTNRSRKKQTVSVLCSLVKSRRYMYQVIRNTTFYTIRPAVTVAMGTTDWDFMPLIVWIVHFAWVHEAESWFGGGIHVCRYAAITAVRTGLLWDLSVKPGIASALHHQQRDNTAFILHHRLVLFLWRESVWSLWMIYCPGLNKKKALKIATREKAWGALHMI